MKFYFAGEPAAHKEQVLIKAGVQRRLVSYANLGDTKRVLEKWAVTSKAPK